MYTETIDLEFPYKAAITDSGKLVILSRRTHDLPPATVVSLSPESAQKLLDLMQGVVTSEPVKHWQHDETGRVCTSPIRPSERWYEIIERQD